MEQLNAQLLERDTHIAELRSDLDKQLSHYDKLNKEKSQNNAENVALKTYVCLKISGGKRECKTPVGGYLAWESIQYTFVIPVNYI